MSAMGLLVDATIKVSLLLTIALAVVAALRTRSAAVRHWVMAVAIGFAAAIPLLGQVVPAWELPLGVASPVQPSAISSTEAVAVPFGAPKSPMTSDHRGHERSGAVWSVTANRVLGSIWIAGLVLNVAILLAGIGRLAAVAARSRKVTDGVWSKMAEEISRACGLRVPVLVLHSSYPTLLVTWGLRRPKVMLPAAARDWSEERIRIVLSHELAHIKRRDWTMQMAAQALRSVYWFNPIVWIASKRLRQDSELACDDAVIGLGVNPGEYAAHLVEVARAFSQHPRTWHPAPAITGETSFERRIRAMLNVHANRRPLTGRVRTAAIVAFLGLTVPLAGLGAQGFGTVSGTITDQFGGILQNATLTLSHADSTAKHEVRSDSNGHFEFVGLPPGDYLLEAKFIGFRTIRNRLILATGQTMQQPVTLQVGSLQEMITVIDDGERAESLVREMPRSARRRPEPCSQSPIGGRIVQPMKVKDVRPQYPSNQRGANALDAVALKALIGTDGLVKEVRVVMEGRNADLDQAAMAAVRQWEFTPTILNCIPVEVDMDVSVIFKAQR
jgi:TonB family protein